MLHIFLCVWLAFIYLGNIPFSGSRLGQGGRPRIGDLCAAFFFFGLENHGKHPLFHRLQEKKALERLKRVLMKDCYRLFTTWTFPRCSPHGFP